MRPARIVDNAWHSEYAKAKRAYDLRHPPQTAKRGRPKAKVEAEELTATGAPIAPAEPAFPDDAIAIALPDAEPVFRQKISNDATTEALVSILAANPDGVLVFAEELAGLLGSMDAYRNRAGKDRPFWLQGKDGGPYTVNRKGAGVTRVPQLALSLLGTIQPEKVRRVLPSLTDDGFAQRFAYAFIQRNGCGKDIPASSKLDVVTSDVALFLANVDPNASYRLSPEADQELQALEMFKGRELANPDSTDALRQYLDKAPNEFGRLALILHHVEWASTIGPDIGSDPPTLISRATARRARRFVEQFLYPNARRIFLNLSFGTEHDVHSRWVAGFILSRGLAEVTPREIQRAYGGLRGPAKHGEVQHVMQTLVTLGWAKPIRRGYEPPRKWKINPRVHDGRFGEMAEKERQRRQLVREAIAETAILRRNAT
jgi:hypothetical protein